MMKARPSMWEQGISAVLRDGGQKTKTKNKNSNNQNYSIQINGGKKKSPKHKKEAFNHDFPEAWLTAVSAACYVVKWVRA